MIKNNISIYLLIFVILLASCKAKQAITESISVDSVSSRLSEIISDESFSIEISYPNDFDILDNNKQEYQNSDSNKLLKNCKTLYSAKWPNTLPIIPGSKIQIKASKNQKQSLQENVTYNNQTKKEVITDKNRKNERQLVIFIVVLIIFICLSVRFAKKVREKFGG